MIQFLIDLKQQICFYFRFNHKMALSFKVEGDNTI